jgi:LPXTG-motif cell wall-anchored protein
MRLINRWSSEVTMRSIAGAGLCCAILALVGIAVADPASATPPSLTVTATFDKASYVPGAAVSVNFSVHNSGTTAAVGITAQGNSDPTELALDQDGFGSFESGVTIPGGGTVAVTLSGNLRSLTATEVTFAGNLFDKNGFGIADFSISAPVTAQNATMSGLVFGDANSNGTADAGEGVSGVQLDLTYLHGDDSFSVTTTSGGQFSLLVPTASYYLTGSGNGWTVIPRVVTIGVGGINLSLRAVKPLGNVLTAKMHFTKNTYAPGETVHVVVTLTNTGSTTLLGIGAECDHAGNPDELNNLGSGWGALAQSGPGVTLLAHQTRTFDITDTVPAEAQQAGEVAVACDFGYPGVDSGQRPTANDTAKVPGLFGALVGDVQYYPHGPESTAVGLANVRLVLVDSTSCPVLTHTATTDSHGHFRIAGVPAGPSYKLYIYPPSGWKVRFSNPTNVFIVANDAGRFFIEVEHGSASVPTVPTCGSSAPPPLANTGVDSGGLAAVGGAALLAGLVLTLSTRRRRTH